MSMYGFSRPLAISSLIECDFDYDKTLTLNNYENIMRQLYNVDKHVLSKRINVFQKYQLKDIGVISCDHLFRNHRNIIQMLNEPLNLSSINCTIEKINSFDKNKDGYLTFLDFNKFIAELIKENV